MIRIRDTLDRHRPAVLVAGLLLSATLLPGGPFGLRSRLRSLYAPLALAGVPDAPASPGGPGERLAALEAEVAALRGENARLREIAGLGLGAAVPAWRPVEARVLCRDRTWPLRRAVVVDRGRSHGLRPGHPVVAGRALAGFVVEADAGTALVRLLDDPASRGGDFRGRAGVSIWRPGGDAPLAEGVLAGQGRGLLRVEMLPAGTVREGDLVVTAPADSQVPPGLVAGRVVSVEEDGRFGLAKATAVPVADLAGLATVVVLATPERGPEEAR
jgi:rod shape-determining protein MreC